MRKRALAAASLSLALLAGCTVGPDYKAPEMKLPPQFTEQPATPAQVADAQRRLQDWWAEFHDPMLNRLVAQALANNYDLRIARQSLIAARQARIIAKSADSPQISANAGAAWSGLSDTVQYPPGDPYFRTFELGLDASWEVDVFGGTRRAVQAADANIDATIAQRRAILVSLLSELAVDYGSLRGTQLRVAITRQTIAAEQRSLALTETSFQRGLGTDLEVEQARTQVETVQAELPALNAQVARLSHAIAVLVGHFPGDLEAELTRPQPLMPVPPVLPASIPSEVVANRPDIQRAERQYAVATAEIGVARAAKFPHFTIPLMLTPSTSYIPRLFDAASQSWSAGLAATQIVYDGGRRDAQEARARAAAEAARLTYEKTVLGGLKEVEDALVNYRAELDRNATLRAAARDAGLARQHAEQLYGAGLTDFLHVLEADRAAYSAQDRLAQSDQAKVLQTVALFKALGGGWQGVQFEDEAPAPATK